MNKKVQQTSPMSFVLVWSRPGVQDTVSEPLDWNEAMRQFDNVTAIRSQCYPASGRRLRVVASSEYRGGTR